MNPFGRRVFGLVAVLGLTLGACSTTVPQTRAPGGSDTVADAPGDVRVLDMQDVSATLEEGDDVEVSVSMELTGMGASFVPVTFTTVTDTANERFSYRSEPVVGTDGFAGLDVPAYEIVGERSGDGVELYVRTGDDPGWTHLVVDAELVGETDTFANPATALEQFDLGDISGLTFSEDGTVDHNGETMVRQVATVDFVEMLNGAIPADPNGDTDDPGAMFAELLESEGVADFLPSGQIELLVDADSTPRRVTLDLAMGSETDALDGSMRTVMTIDPAPAGGVELPAADDVTETVQVDSYAELVAQLGPALTG